MVDPLNEMDRMLDRLSRPHPSDWLRTLGSEWPDRFDLEQAAPRIDVIDKDEEILLRAEIPGVSKEDLEITMTDAAVTIRGTANREERKEQGDYYYCETSSGQFYRTVRLPTPVNSNKAEATYNDGMLELTLPKLEATKRYKVKITSRVRVLAVLV